MVLAVNIGNTNIAIGCKQGTYFFSAKYETNLVKTYKDFIFIIRETMNNVSLEELKIVKGAIISSVVPNLTKPLEVALKVSFNIEAIKVSSNMKMNLNLDAYDKTQIGSDRIAVCEGAICKFSGPLIVFDCGTATTINVVNDNKCFMGGSILAGVSMGLHALAKNTAQLKEIELSKTFSKIIGENTKECLMSGAIYGNAAMVDGMVQYIEENQKQKSTVVITGGNGNLLVPICKTKLIYEPDLLLNGLYFLYEKNNNNKGENHEK